MPRPQFIAAWNTEGNPLSSCPRAEEVVLTTRADGQVVAINGYKNATALTDRTKPCLVPWDSCAHFPGAR